MYRCIVCNRVFKKMFSLKNHYRKKHGVKSCPLCGVEFQSEMKLIFHCKKMHLRGCRDHLALYYLLKGMRFNRVKLLTLGKTAEEILKIKSREKW